MTSSGLRGHQAPMCHTDRHVDKAPISISKYSFKKTPVHNPAQGRSIPGTFQPFSLAVLVNSRPPSQTNKQTNKHKINKQLSLGREGSTCHTKPISQKADKKEFRYTREFRLELGPVTQACHLLKRLRKVGLWFKAILGNLLRS